jgi:hypothetical protein
MTWSVFRRDLKESGSGKPPEKQNTGKQHSCSQCYSSRLYMSAGIENQTFTSS